MCFLTLSIIRFRLTNVNKWCLTWVCCYTPCCFIEISSSPRWATLTRQCPLQRRGCASRALDGPPWSHGRGTAGRERYGMKWRCLYIYIILYYIFNISIYTCVCVCVTVHHPNWYPIDALILSMNNSININQIHATTILGIWSARKRGATFDQPHQQHSQYTCSWSFLHFVFWCSPKHVSNITSLELSVKTKWVLFASYVCVFNGRHPLFFTTGSSPVLPHVSGGCGGLQCHASTEFVHRSTQSLIGGDERGQGAQLKMPSVNQLGTDWRWIEMILLMVQKASEPFGMYQDPVSTIHYITYTSLPNHLNLCQVFLCGLRNPHATEKSINPASPSVAAQRIPRPFVQVA